MSNHFASIDLCKIIMSLLTRVKGDVYDHRFIEPLILVLGDSIKFAEPEISNEHILNYVRVLGESLTPDSIRTFNYEVLTELPAVIEKIEKLAPDSLRVNKNDILKSLSDRIEYYKCILREEDKNENYLQLESQLEKTRNLSLYSGVNLAMVSFNDSYPKYSIGKILKASLDLHIAGEWNFTKRFDPLIGFRGKISEEDTFADQLKRSVELAERFFRDKSNISEFERTPREYIFEVTNEDISPDWTKLFKGGSAGLGFTLQCMTVLDSMNLRSKQRLLRNDTGFTGSVNDDGTIKTIDKESLPFKVQAAFYSHLRHLVIPEYNEEIAEKTIINLKNKYPNRDLDIIPVSTAIQAYEDQRVTKESIVPHSRVFISKAKRRKNIILTGLSTIIALVVILILLPARIKKEIVRAGYDGKAIRFYNKYDYNFGSYPMPYYIYFKENIYTDVTSKSFHPICDDINGDGKIELLFISVESDKNATGPFGKLHLHLFSSSGKLINHISLWDSLEVLYPDNNRIVFHNFTFCFDTILDLDKDGYKEIVISFAEQLYYPSGIIAVSLKESSYESFVHFGHIKHFVVGDFDKDQESEIVVAGELNPLEAAVIVVLDPSNLKGSTPDLKTKFIGFNTNIAKYYIKLPVSELCNLFKDCDKSVAHWINYSDKKRLVFGVVEGAYNALLYEFDENWRCSSIDYSGEYFRTYCDLKGFTRDEGIDSFAVMASQLKNSIRYLDGKSWSNEPVINSGYINNKNNLR